MSNEHAQAPHDASGFQDQSSLVTPNLSYGGNKLQNQLEQVLMMKSGEFSAHGGRPIDHHYLQNSNGSLGNTDGQNSSGIMGGQNVVYMHQQNPQNYGNPNFVPPQQHFSGSQASFKGEVQHYDNQQHYSNDYKNQFPATF
jgi:hypothetical protein